MVRFSKALLSDPTKEIDNIMDSITARVRDIEHRVSYVTMSAISQTERTTTEIHKRVDVIRLHQVEAAVELKDSLVQNTSETKAIMAAGFKELKQVIVEEVEKNLSALLTGCYTMFNEFSRKSEFDRSQGV